MSPDSVIDLRLFEGHTSALTFRVKRIDQALSLGDLAVNPVESKGSLKLLRRSDCLYRRHLLFPSPETPKGVLKTDFKAPFPLLLNSYASWSLWCKVLNSNKAFGHDCPIERLVLIP